MGGACGGRERWVAAPPEIAPVSSSKGRARRQVLALTFGTPARLYSRFLNLKTDINEEASRGRAYELMAPSVMRQYASIMLGVLFLAPALGLLVARRVTRRIVRLKTAAAEVAAGNLEHRISPQGRDELDQFAAAFDQMVGELKDARARLTYVQKLDAWQEVARRLAHEIKTH